MFHLIQKNR
jgi:hypothetical protein